MPVWGADYASGAVSYGDGDRTLDRMRVRGAYRINAACDTPSGRCYGEGNLAGCVSLAMSVVETYRA
jgi:hypothetical protein